MAEGSASREERGGAGARPRPVFSTPVKGGIFALIPLPHPSSMATIVDDAPGLFVGNASERDLARLASPGSRSCRGWAVIAHLLRACRACPKRTAYWFFNALLSLGNLVPQERFELPTPSLRMRCSTS